MASGIPCNTTRYQAFIDHYPTVEFSRTHAYFDWAFGPTCASRRPALLARFDWHFSREEAADDYRRRADPRSVYAGPALAELVAEAEAAGLALQGGQRRPLAVFPWNDQLLSSALGRDLDERMKLMSKLRRFFRPIFHLAKDIEVDGIMTMPFGLSEHYLRLEGVLDAAAAAVEAASVSDLWKERNVLAAWGTYTSSSMCNRTPEGRLAQRSRAAARRWAAAAAARGAGVELRSIRPQRWWPELSKYRFLLSPLGISVQSPKMTEALLVLTIPIIERGPWPAHDELVRFGFPIIVVEAWAEVSHSKLGEWWAALSPRLVSFRANCLTTEGFWRLLTGDMLRCE